MKPAIRCYAAALREAPCFHVRRCLAAAFAHTGDLRGALRETEEMIQMQPHNKKARFLNQAISDVINAMSAPLPENGSQVLTIASLLTPEELKANSYRCRMTTRPVLDQAAHAPDERQLLRTHKIHPDVLHRMRSSLPAGASMVQYAESSRPFWDRHGMESSKMRKRAAVTVPGGSAGSRSGLVAVGTELQTVYRDGPVGGSH